MGLKGLLKFQSCCCSVTLIIPMLVGSSFALSVSFCAIVVVFVIIRVGTEGCFVLFKP